MRYAASEKLEIIRLVVSVVRVFGTNSGLN